MEKQQIETPGATPRASFNNAEELGRQSNSRMSELGRMSSSRATTVFDIYAVPDEDEVVLPGGYVIESGPEERGPKKYRGRYRMWPGIVFLTSLAVAAVVLVIIYANEAHEKMKARTDYVMPRRKRIKDGSGNFIYDDDDLDVPGNPNKYPNRKCAHLDYISKNGFIYGVTPSGKEIKLPIKGINWSGMETGWGIPYGLWDNLQNGTTVYQVAAFLARNNFNSVRLPLSVYNLNRNMKPYAGFINSDTNKAISIKSYRSLLKSIVKALGYRGISVLLDLHTLSPTHTGELWYSPEIPEPEILKSIDILGKDLCKKKYWNIVGLDLKNEPSGANWASGPANMDWRLGAEKLGERMLKACSKWTVQVEGISAANSITIEGQQFMYFDWWGGGLQRAAQNPVRLSIKNKLVYSPHYYSPAVYPAKYFYTGGTTGAGGTLQGFIERSDKSLKGVVSQSMFEMFGHLTKSQDGAVIMGEFGGLYGNDRHPKKTTKRVIDYTIDNLVDPKKGYGGGYVWCLNPESGYEYNPVDTMGLFQYGLLGDDWLAVHKDYLKALEKFDKMDEMKLFPCIEEE